MSIHTKKRGNYLSQEILLSEQTFIHCSSSSIIVDNMSFYRKLSPIRYLHDLPLLILSESDSQIFLLISSFSFNFSGL